MVRRQQSPRKASLIGVPECLLLMLWTAPPPARERQGVGAILRTPEKSVPMVRRIGARIMNIFAEGGQLICLQTHFFGSAVAVILAGLKSLGQIGPPLLFKQPSGPRRRPERFRVRACAVQGRGRRLQHVRTRRR
jgi:hypothetical protein